ncbi:MAG: hypothetical protein ACO3YQ_05845 [Flavobacteriales bacterium]
MNSKNLTALNALARYADKPDFHFYLDTVRADQFDLKTLAWDAAIPVDHVALPNGLTELLELLESVPFARPRGPLITRLAAAVESLYAAEEMPEYLWRRLNRSARGRSLTWEGFPPLDDLSGIGRVVLEDYLACSQQDRDHVFASTLLAMGQLFVGQTENAARILEKTADRMDDVHPVVHGRLLGLQLVLAEESGDLASIDSAKEHALHALAASGTEGEHTLLQPLCRLAILSPTQSLREELLDGVLRMQNSPELWVEAGPFLGALRLEWAWLTFLRGRKRDAWNLVRKLSGPCFPFFERKTSELYLHILGAAIAPKEHERRHHAERASTAAAHLQYPWLQKRLADQIEAHL